MSRYLPKGREDGLLTIARLTADIARAHVDTDEYRDKRNQRAELEQVLAPLEDRDVLVIDRELVGLRVAS